MAFAALLSPYRGHCCSSRGHYCYADSLVPIAATPVGIATLLVLLPCGCCCPVDVLLAVAALLVLSWLLLLHLLSLVAITALPLSSLQPVLSGKHLFKVLLGRPHIALFFFQTYQKSVSADL